MSLLDNLPLDDLGPARLWSRLDPEVRREAGRAVYDGSWDDPEARAELDRAIAAAIHFRPLAVRRLPREKRLDYLARAVRPDDGLATTLLLALHLGKRRPLLRTFLDHLEIPNENGAIDETEEHRPPDPAALLGAANRLLREYPRGDVELYLAGLLALDGGVWAGLKEVLPKLAAPRSEDGDPGTGGPGTRTGDTR